MSLQPDTVAAVNHLIERSHFTVSGRHEWTDEDHKILEATLKLVERDVQTPQFPVGWQPSRRRASMRAHRFGSRR